MSAWKKKASAYVDSRPWLKLGRDTLKEFSEDDAPLHAAALSFFSLFAVVPLFVVVIVLASLMWGGGESARGQLFEGADQVLGDEQARAVQALIENAQVPSAGVYATLAGLVVLAFAASRAFAYLTVSLNRIWDVEPRADRSLARTAKKRFLSFAMVIGVGILLLASLVVSAFFAGLTRFLAETLAWNPLALEAGRIVVTFLVLWGVFALMFKYLPDAQIRWGDVASGAAATAALFAVGQIAIGYVISGSRIVSTFGGLASVVAVLLWFYYTALIVLLGAEFTQVYARWRGRPIRPEEDIAKSSGRKNRPGAGDEPAERRQSGA